MNKLQKGLLAAGVALACSGQAFAAPAFGGGENSIFFNNFENLYRVDTACAPGACLAANAGDPAGYRRVDATVAGNVSVGDIFVGILNVQNIANDGSDVYNSAAGNRFTGYFAQRVAAINAANPAAAIITLGTAVDPFGILAAGEMFRLYSNTPGFTSGGATVAAGIAAATAGQLWAGLGLAGEGYAYTRTNLTIPCCGTATEAFAALDIINTYPAYNLGVVKKLNDFNEDAVGGVIANPASQVCSPAEIANAAISCTDIVGTSEIEFNNAFGTGASPWQIASNDPFEVNKVPEPASLSLFALALAGLGFSVRRRRSA